MVSRAQVRFWTGYLFYEIFVRKSNKKSLDFIPIRATWLDLEVVSYKLPFLWNGIWIPETQDDYYLQIVWDLEAGRQRDYNLIIKEEGES